MPEDQFDFTNSGYDTETNEWQADAFADNSLTQGTAAYGEVEALLQDLLPEGKSADEYMKYLEKYDTQKEEFAGMQQQLSQAGAQSSYDTSMATTELGMRSAMGQAESGAKSSMGKMLQAGRKVDGFGGRQRAMNQGKEDVMAQRGSTMDRAKQQAEISKESASDSYTQSMGAADLSYQQSVYGAREDYQDDIFSMISNIVQMVNA